MFNIRFYSVIRHITEVTSQMRFHVDFNYSVLRKIIIIIIINISRIWYHHQDCRKTSICLEVEFIASENKIKKVRGKQSECVCWFMSWNNKHKPSGSFNQRFSRWSSMGWLPDAIVSFSPGLHTYGLGWLWCITYDLLRFHKSTSCSSKTQAKTLNSWNLCDHKSELSFGSRHRLACVEWEDVGMASPSGE